MTVRLARDVWRRGSASFTVGTSITLSVTNGRDAIWSGRVFERWPEDEDVHVHVER